MKQPIFLVIIVLISAILRLYQLGSIPVGFHRDEAFLGYNAYSLMQTGREMTGTVIPLHLTSFLYSPAGYSYAAIPGILIFGLSPFSVRLPSAIFGIITVIAIYFLASALLPPKSKLPGFPAFAAFFLAISPWHINLSRTATENTIVVCIFTFAFIGYIQFLKNQRIWWFIYSVMLFASTYLLYQAPRAFLPFLMPILLIYGWKHIRTTHRIAVIVITIITIMLPVISILLSPTLSTRIRTVSIFASAETQLTIDESQREDGVAHVPLFPTRIFHNKLLSYSDAVLKNYFSHFSYNFLFTDSGLPDRYRVPNAGLIYPIEAIFILVGIVVLITSAPWLAVLLIGWILLAPLGSALTSDDVPNLQRTLIIFPVLSLLSGVGASPIAYLTGKSSRIKFLAMISIGALIFSIASYLHAYYIHQVYHRPWYRHEGYEKLVDQINQYIPSYEKAVITNHESSPTIFFLFYNKVNPHLIQSLWASNMSQDLNTVSFPPYEFSKESCPLRLSSDPISPATKRLSGVPNILYVNFSECDIKDPRVRELKTIKRNDGSVVFRILEVLP